MVNLGWNVSMGQFRSHCRGDRESRSKHLICAVQVVFLAIFCAMRGTKDALNTRHCHMTNINATKQKSALSFYKLGIKPRLQYGLTAES